MSDDETPTNDFPVNEEVSVPATPVADPASMLRSLQDRSERGSKHRDEQIESLKAEIKELQGQRKRLDSIADTLSSISQLAEQERWCGALRELRGAKKLRDQLAEFDPSSSQAIDAIDPWLESKARDAIAALPRTLIAELGDEVPDPESRAPRFVFRRSFLTVEINRTKFEATASTRAGKPVKLDADAAKLAEHVRAELARCFDRQIDLDDFARRLREGYEKTDAGRRSEPARIREVVAQLGDEVPLDEFSVDLSRLLASAEGAVQDAAGLKLDHTKDTDRGLLLPGLEDRGYFGSMFYSTQEPQPKDNHVDA
jgi:hypothetical protein